MLLLNSHLADVEIISISGPGVIRPFAFSRAIVTGMIELSGSVIYLKILEAVWFKIDPSETSLNCSNIKDFIADSILISQLLK